MSETTSGASGPEPTGSWYRESGGGMPVSPAPARGTDPAGPSGPAGPSNAGSPLHPEEVHATAPAVRQPHWSGKKTAVAAALAIGLSTAGVVGAAAVVRDGGGSASDGPAGGFGRHQLPGGQAPNGQFPNGQPGQLGQSNQLPGPQLPAWLSQRLQRLGDDGDSTSDDDSSAATDT